MIHLARILVGLLIIAVAVVFTYFLLEYTKWVLAGLIGLVVAFCVVAATLQLAHEIGGWFLKGRGDE